MSYRIDKQDGFFEVTVWNESSEWEILQAVQELHRLDPGKEKGDLWVLAPEVTIPVATFAKIAENIKPLCPHPIAPRSAVVSTNELQKAMLGLYRDELRIVPLDFRIFTDRAQAVKWLTS